MNSLTRKLARFAKLHPGRTLGASRSIRPVNAGMSHIFAAAGIASVAAIVLIIAGIVIFGFTGGTTASLAGNTANTSTNISTSNWGTSTANSVAPSFALITSLAGLAVIPAAAGLVIAAIFAAAWGTIKHFT